jgi:hypothetical protein
MITDSQENIAIFRDCDALSRVIDFEFGFNFPRSLKNLNTINT